MLFEAARISALAQRHDSTVAAGQITLLQLTANMIGTEPNLWVRVESQNRNRRLIML